MSPEGSRPLDDGELAARARQGNVTAYEDLVRRHQAVAFRVAYVITGDEEAAKDAVQTGFIKAYYALDRFREGAPVRPWLLKIVANEARNQARALRRRARYEVRQQVPTFRQTDAVVAGGEGRLRDDAAPSPEEAALSALARQALLAAVNRLSDADRQVIACRYFLDLSEADTAIALRCARGTVKSRLSRAIRRLRGALTATEIGVVGKEPSDE
jgi:RNA polymerase sigma-70 factor (ECF subfamily)